MNNQTIGYLERGDYKPSLELAMKIAAYFGMSIELLFSSRRLNLSLTLCAAPRRLENNYNDDARTNGPSRLCDSS